MTDSYQTRSRTSARVTSPLSAVVTYVFLHADVATASDGLRAGAIFGLLFGIAMAFDLYGVTNW